MRFIAMIKADESDPFTPPPPELLAALDAQAKEAAGKGTVLKFQGLHPSADAEVFDASEGEVLLIDGPFAEAKEVVGGYADFECSTKEEAGALIGEFLKLHVDLWPDFRCTCELRQVFHEG